ncbi:MAG: hypothetical protein H7338_13600 [Candidatus Sericytochromatia bacterium]|nr:hypothetical protein [Candidatus Sericytochromatia bacterium]
MPSRNPKSAMLTALPETTDGQASRHDRELWLWIALTLAVMSLPLLLAWLNQPAGALFTGFLSDRDQDAWSYIAKMHQGYDGSWFYHNLYSDEPHSGVAGVFFYYLTLGHLARWTGMSLIATYHLARLICTALFLVGLDRFLALLWPERRDRRWALVLILFCGGFGWLSEVNAYWGDPRWWPGWLFPADLVWTGLTTFGSLLLYSHYPLALWLILSCYRLAYEAETAQRWPWLATLAAATLAVHHPYDIVPVSLVLGIWHLWRALRHGWRSVARVALIGVGVAIPVAYYYWIFTYHPTFSRWAGQNVCLSPHPAVYLLAFGGAMLLALPGLRRLERDSLWPLLAIWVVANAFLLYAPVSWQRLMMMGLPMVLMMWGARGLMSLAAKSPRHRRAMLVAGVALLIPGPLSILLIGTTSRSYVPAAEAAAYRWLARQPQDGRAILGHVITGNRAVALTGHPAVLGHWSETPDYHRMLTETQRWYETGSPDSRLGDPWLTRHHVGWIVYGPRERAWQPTPPLAAPPAYAVDGYTIWARQAQR